MAATRLITMHQNKGKSVAKSLSDRTDYAKNGEKTEHVQYISSYACLLIFALHSIFFLLMYRSHSY